jgi:hypothetical protein
MGSLRRIKWALRKVKLPVSKDSLVLDVGSGSCPYPRSDVLLERFFSPEHRCGSGLLLDRTIVFADALQMPFKDKAFDFIVASHILEHMKKPELLLKELMRVGKAGYIETPNAMFERLNPYTIHCLEIMTSNGRLIIHKKGTLVEDSFLGNLDLFKKDSSWKEMFEGAPDMFHVRCFWKDRIDFEVLNPDESCDWMPDYSDDGSGNVHENYTGTGWRGWGLRILRNYYRRSYRKSIDLLNILACPECKGSLHLIEGRYVCQICRKGYSADPYPNFNKCKKIPSIT